MEFSIFSAGVKASVLQQDVKAKPVPGMQVVNQVHGTDILIVEKLENREGGYDAMITKEYGLPLMVRTADCIPLLLAGDGIVAAVHAGWRGLVAEIIPKTIARMVDMGADTERIKVGIGPSLGFSCSQFSNPREEIPEKFHFAIDGNLVDLNRICDWQLEQAGVLAGNVERMDVCTKCNSEWFSWRRDHDERRFGTVIELLL